MTDVRVYKNIKHRSASVKQQRDNVHQNATEALHATLSNSKIEKKLLYFLII